MSDTDYMLALAQQFQITIEELLKYDQCRDIKQKQFVCQYWLRGTCCFTPEFCHFAHGIKYLHYSIDSITELKPLPSAEDVKLKYKIIGFPKQYFVVEKFQSDAQVQEQFKQYSQFVGKAYDPNKIYTLREIKYERSVKPLILNTLQLSEVSQFYLKILELLGVDVIPKALFIHELNRVGYSYMGSHFARPNTLIFHLSNTGICFQKSLTSDIVLKGYDDSFMKQQSLKVLKLDEQHEEDPDEEPEEEEAEEIIQNPPETQIGIKKLQFIIRVKENLVSNYTNFLQKTLDSHPELAKLTDIDDFSFAISEYIEENNQIHQEHILPYLEQFLRLIDKIWDEYANEYGFSHIKFINSRDSGIPVELIMKNFTPEQKQELQNYLSKPKIKYYLCQYWLRGICIFQKKNCRFAHGLEDLEINFDIKRDFANLDKEQRPLRYNQKPLINHRTYRILYLHQYLMIEDGDLKMEHKRNQFQIDNIKEYRDRIREHIQKRMIVNLFRKVSNGQPQSKAEIMKYFTLVGFVQRGVDLSELKIIKILLTNDVVFEKEVVKNIKEEQNDPSESKKEKKKVAQKQILLIPVKDYQIYHQFYEDIIFKGLINIFQNKVTLPIEESLIKKEIYKYDQVLEMPGLYQYFLRNPLKKYTLIDYFQECILGQVKTRLKDKIHPEVYEQIQDDGLNLIQFEADMASLNLIIEALYGAVITKQQAAINFEKVKKQIEMKASDNDKQNSLLNYLVKEKKHLIIAINGSWYVHNQNAIGYERQKKCRCGSTYSQPSQIKQINENNLMDKILQFQELVDKDVRNTIIVDSPEKLLAAQDFLISDVNYIAIDLEGNLRKGDIWLVQMGIMAQKHRIIFIFDLMKIKYLEADLLFHGQMLSVVKQVIEDPQICKVFHDCKRDSQALHLNGICPKNIADTSCTYQLLEYVKLNNQQGLKKQKTTIQIAKEIFQVATPPINSVLTKYGALHGGNELKEEMHEKFKHPQGEQFFTRPNPAFMYYSARDVEDLVQVYLEMQAKVPELRYIIEKMSHKNKEFFVQIK